MSPDEWDAAVDVVVRLVLLKDEIWRHVALQPTAVMLPPSVAPGVDEALGLPVVRGDRAALIFEAPGDEDPS